MCYISKSSKQTEKIGEKIASEMKGGEVICLYGDLGAGKTTFVHGFMEYFLPGKRIVSPTFIIVRHYTISHGKIKNIYHIDLYRISNDNEIKTLGINEFMNKSDSLVLIEWAGNLGKFLPEKRIDIRFEIKSEKTRIIKL